MTPSARQARALVAALVRGGVTEAVLCPGSRNAPLSFALHAADAAGQLRLHVRIDERTAGFLALGLALGSGRPVPVACTSGTAAANLHPAMLEASYAGVPVLAMTADRPPELIGTGANQTIVQPGLYGTAVRFQADAVEAGAEAVVVGRALAAATGAAGGWAGPVHLNLPFAEPLTPGSGPGWPPAASAVAPAAEQPADGPPCGDPPALPLDPAAPTLVVAGSGHRAWLPAGIPVVAEPSSALWPAAVRTGPWLLGCLPVRAELRPRQVVVVGRPTLHRSVAALLASEGVDAYAVAASTGAGGAQWTGLPGRVRAIGSLPPMRPPAEFAQAWQVADVAASAALDAALDAGGAPAGLVLARELVAALPAGALLVLGSSNPVRDVSLAAVPRRGVTVLANRGVSGIDGTVSTAIGAALALGSVPAYALLGDLTLLHDATGLVIGPAEPWPDLTVMVLNDRGGGVFSLLEQGAPEHAGAFERVFGTPHRVDLAALAAAMGISHSLLVDPSLIRDVVGRPGLRMVEVPADRATLRAGHAAIATAVASAVAGSSVAGREAAS